MKNEEAPRERSRRTVVLDAATFACLIGQAAAMAASAGASGAPARSPSLAVEREALLGLLKAFVDAAQPAGGLAMAADGRPLDLAQLVQTGHDNAWAGLTQPKVLAKIRAGKPLDERIARSVLCFFRHVLARPLLTLDDLGAVEPARMNALHSVRLALHAAREDLPASIAEGLWRRAEETAGYAWVHDDVVVEYRDLRHFVDTCGAHRIRLLRRERSRPIRLAGHPGRMRPVLSFEWHEWRRIEAVRLVVRVLDRADGLLREVEYELHKRIDPERGFVRVEIAPEVPPELLALLEVSGVAARGPRHELLWEVESVFNAVDRDIVVSYAPMNKVRICFDAAAHPAFSLAVGDSPGLARCEGGWRLDRTLMPREVIAVRIRLSAIDFSRVDGLSAGGEWRGSLPPPAASAMRP